MACPFFYPLTRAEAVKQPARVPLGVLHDGRCERGGAADKEICNFGYARSSCDAFPPDAEADAVRFTRLDNRTVYILEKDYQPVRFGECGELLEGAIRRQSEVFLQWLTR